MSSRMQCGNGHTWDRKEGDVCCGCGWTNVCPKCGGHDMNEPRGGDDLDNYKSVPGRLVSLPSATVLRLEPGDVLVLKSSTTLSGPLKMEWLGHWRKLCPGHDIVFVDGGVDLQVVRPSKTTEAGT